MARSAAGNGRWRNWIARGGKVRIRVEETPPHPLVAELLAAGWNPGELAWSVGLKPETGARWESGQSQPSKATLAKLEALRSETSISKRPPQPWLERFLNQQ